MLCACKYFYRLDADRPDRRASHHFCADSEEERKEWLKNLKQVLYGSKGGGKNYPEVPVLGLHFKLWSQICF